MYDYTFKDGLLNRNFCPNIIYQTKMRIPANIQYFLTPKSNAKIPDFFDSFILNSDLLTYKIAEVNQLYQELLKSDETIEFVDYGAGSKVLNKEHRTIAQLAEVCGTGLKYGPVLNKTVSHFKVKNILELGTSIGIGTAYLSAGNRIEKLISIDADTNSLKYAKKHLQSLGINDCLLINETFDNALENGSINGLKFDLCFIDGNHLGSAVKKYYNLLVKNYISDKAILIFDDINWSKDMFKAWKSIAAEENGSMVLDLYRMGIIFRGYNNLPKKYFRVKLNKNY